MFKPVLRLATFVVSLGLIPAVWAASGTAVGVDPAAEARGNGTRTLVVGSDILIGDRVVTSANGLVQILFSDNTRLVVGPRSSLVIEDYLLRDNGSAGKFAVNALSGTFRFITGKSAKDRYQITTPAGQIGVRGTEFDLYVGDNRRAYVLQHGGTTINCPAGGGACELLNSRCEYGVMSRSEMDVVGSSRELQGAERDRVRSWFIFAVNQSRLLRPFRISGAEQCMRQAPAEFVVPQSISDPGIIRPRRPKKPQDEDTDGDDYVID